MKILIFSDIHASKEACRQIEELLPQFDKAICCGDIVGYGKEPKYCIDFIRENGIQTVKGNHDAMIIGECVEPENSIVKSSNAFTREKLSDKYLDWLRALPIELAEGDLYVRHTLGRTLTKYVYGDQDIDDRMANWIQNIKQPNIAIGHTHTQYSFKFKGKQIVNPSSIAKGRRGEPRGYAIYEDSEFKLVSLVEELI